MTADTIADLYLRLSDFRDGNGGTFPLREAALHAEAARLRLDRHTGSIIENDLQPEGRRAPAKPASAYKRQRVTGPDGPPVGCATAARSTGCCGTAGSRSSPTWGPAQPARVLAEDLDRVARDPRDIEDLIDAVAACGGTPGRCPAA